MVSTFRIENSKDGGEGIDPSLEGSNNCATTKDDQAKVFGI